MRTNDQLASLPVKTLLADICLLEGDGPTPDLYAFLQGGDDTTPDPSAVVAAEPDPAGPWQEQSQADRDALVARYRALRPLAANHLYNPDDALHGCLACGGWGPDRHGALLTAAQSDELDLLAQLLGDLEGSEDVEYLDDLDGEPDIPAGWVLLRDTLVPDYARAHDLAPELVRDRAEHTLDYRGVRFVAFDEAMLHDGIRQGPHTGHEIEYVEEEAIVYCRQVVRVVGGVPYLAEEVTTEEGIPDHPAYLYCGTCDRKVAPDEIGAADLSRLG